MMHIAILYGYGLQGSRSADDAMDMARGFLEEGYDVTLLCHETQQEVFLEIEDLLVSEADWGLEGYLLGNSGAKLCVLGVQVPILPVASGRALPGGSMRVGEFSQEQRDRYVELMVARLERVHAHKPVGRVLVHHMSLLVEVGARFRARAGCALDVMVHGTALRHSATVLPELQARLHKSLPYVDSFHMRRTQTLDMFCNAFPAHALKAHVLNRRLPSFQDGWFRGRLNTPSLPSYVPPKALPVI